MLKDCKVVVIFRTYSPESSVMGMGQFPICKLKRDFLRTSVTAYIIHKNIFSAPFGIFYMRTEILKKKIQKIFYKTPQWGASQLQTPVSKWELPKWDLQRTLGYSYWKTAFRDL